MPELAALYVAGLPASLLLSLLHAFLFRRKMNSTSMTTVQRNLQTVGLFWSDSESAIKLIEGENVAADSKAYYRTIFILGFVCFFLSWVGFALQLLVMTSIRFIARPRLESAVFGSKIASQKISSEEIETELSALREQVMNSVIPTGASPKKEGR